MKVLGLFIFIMFGCTTVSAHAGAGGHEGPNKFESWRNSVVQILITCIDGEVPHSASAVLVSDSGHILTAAHSGNACLDVKKARVNVIVDQYGPTKDVASATLIFRSVDGIATPSKFQSSNTEWQDVALWQIDSFESLNVDLKPMSLASDAPELGAGLSIVGFPGLAFGYFRQQDANGATLEAEPPYRGVGVSIFQTYLMSASARVNESPYRLQYDGGTLAGLSGAPILNSDGELVGLHSGRSVQFVSNLIATNCIVPDSSGNCTDVPDFTETYRKLSGEIDDRQVKALGLNVDAHKNVLENYSWGTSVWGLPQTFLTEIRGTEQDPNSQQQQPLARFCAEGEAPVMVQSQPHAAVRSPILVPSCRTPNSR